MVEVWKDIVGYEGKYQVSNMGRVKSLVDRWGRKREMILKLSVNNKNGYVQVNLHKDSKQKTYRVHKLVALAFVDGYEEGLVVNHIDEDKTNNCAWNLEWVTYKENSIHSSYKLCGENNPMYGKKGKDNPLYGIPLSEETRKKMSENHADVSGKNNPNYGKGKKVMCVETGEVFLTLNEAGKFINIKCPTNISRAIKRNGSCKGLHWKYVN